MKPLLKLIPYCINAPVKYFSYESTKFRLIKVYNYKGDIIQYITKLGKTQSNNQLRKQNKKGDKTKFEKVGHSQYMWDLYSKRWQ